MMNKQKQYIQFGYETQKLYSILSAVQLIPNSIEREERIGKFQNLSVCRMYFDNYVIGITLNLSTSKIECWVNEYKIGYNVETRSHVLSLLAKFYDNVTLNASDKITLNTYV